MAMITERRISLALGVVFIAIAVVAVPSWRLAVGACVYIGFCLVCIWYGDELGAYRGGRINSPTPGIMIRIVGWILLLLTPLVVYSCRLNLLMR